MYYYERSYLYTLCIIGILLCSYSFVEGKDQITLLFAEQDQVDIVPGSEYTLTSLLTNKGTDSLSVEVEIISPQFEPYSPTELNFEIEPGATEIVLAVMHIPSSCASGHYPIIVRVVEPISRRVLSERTCVFDILPQLGVEIEMLEPELVVRAGTNFELPFTCQNTGNTPVYAIIEMCNDNFFFIDAPRFEVQLLPGERETFYLTCCASDLIAKDYQSNALSIRLVESETNCFLCQKTAKVQLLAGVYEKIDYFNRIPAYLRFFSVGNVDAHSSVIGGLEFAGGGFLSPDSLKEIEFCFRFPSKADNPIYNEHQKLYLAYQDPLWKVILGDTRYHLSPLIERGFYGRGGGINLDFCHYHAAIFYAQSPFDKAFSDHELGGYVGYDLSPLSYIAANLFKKKITSNPTSRITSLYGTAEILPRTVIEAEVAKDFRDSPSSEGKGLAYFVDLHGNWIENGWYRVRKEYAATNYFGSLRDASITNLSIDVPFHTYLHGNINASRSRQNLNLANNRKCICPDYKTVSILLRTLIPCGLQVSGNGFFYRAEDKSLVPQFDLYQQWGKMFMSYQTGCCYLSSNISFGKEDDYLHNRRSKLLKLYRIYFTCNRWSRVEWDLFAEIGNITPFQSTHCRQYYGGSLRYRYSPGCWLRFYSQFGHNRPKGASFQHYIGELLHPTRQGHTLSMRFERFNTSHHAFPNSTKFYVSYTIPFGLVISRRKDIASVGGTLIDSASAQPLANSLVSINNTTVMTDDEGYFFLAVPPGHYDMEPGLIQGGLVVAEEESLFVDVKPGCHNSIKPIAFCEACTIKGKVKIYEVLDTPENLEKYINGDGGIEYIESGGIQGLYVSAVKENGKAKKSCLTLKDGSFCFDRLTPGRWKVILSTKEISKKYFIHHTKYECTLDEGESQDIIFSVMAK